MGGGLVGEELLRELADEEPAWPGFREPQSDAWRLVVLLSRACPLCLSLGGLPRGWTLQSGFSCCAVGSPPGGSGFRFLEADC